jgi:Cytochrome c7 and related cytochrome c
MAQIFHRSTNSISRATIFGAVFVVAALFWAAAQVQRSPYVTYAGVVRPQPAPFSHQHHVAGLGIDCRYCHTSVENSRFAGIPPTKTCMNCHAQIWTKAPMLEPVRESFRTDKSLVWTRVNDLPDFVYFDHSIHINKGVGCNTCHGPVDRMPLMYNYASLQMEWCLNCHRAPEKNLRPRDQVFNMRYQAPTADSPVIVDGKSFVDQDSLGLYLVKAYKLRSERDITSCNTCHR